MYICYIHTSVPCPCIHCTHVADTGPVWLRPLGLLLLSLPAFYASARVQEDVARRRLSHALMRGQIGQLFGGELAELNGDLLRIWMVLWSIKVLGWFPFAKQGLLWQVDGDFPADLFVVSPLEWFPLLHFSWRITLPSSTIAVL